MSNIESAIGGPIGQGGRGGSLKLIAIVLAAVLLVIGGGGAAWWFLLGGKAMLGGAARVETPLPHFLTIKPFVISVGSNVGSARFVQLGPTLQLSGPPAAELVNAVLPQVQDVMRQTVLSFKSDELQSAAGINKLRSAIVTRLNEMLVQVLGPDRIERANGGKRDLPLVQSIYFPTLVVE